MDRKAEIKMMIRIIEERRATGCSREEAIERIAMVELLDRDGPRRRG